MSTFAFAWLEASDPGPEGWIGYAKLMFLLCAILIGLLLIVRFWLTKMSDLRKSSSGSIRVFARFLLEPRKTLYVVGVGKNRLLLASSEAGVQLMTALDPNDWHDSQPTKGDASTVENNFSRLIGFIGTGRKS